MQKEKNLNVKILRNGLRVVLEDIKDFRSVSIGLGVIGGSVSDPRGLEGMAHLVEHMVFKGSKKRNSYQIKEPIEKSGGTLNGFTSREQTFYYAKVPDFKATETLDILFDMTLNPLFDERELVKEKNIVIEEIRELNDDPYGKVHDLFLREAFNGSLYGSAIFGSEETVLKINRLDILEYHHKFYTPSNMILSVCGRISEGILNKIDKLDQRYEGTNFVFESSSPIFKPNRKEIFELKNGINQVHLLLGTSAPGRKEEDFFAFSILNTLLGDGMSSRLFNRIREEEGLAYNIHTEYIAFKDSGLFLIYSSTSPDRHEKLLNEINKELQEILSGNIDQGEIGYGKERVKGKLLLATENTFSRMYKNFEDIRIFGQVLDVDNLIVNFDKVDIKEIKKMCEKYLKGDRLVVCLKPRY